MINPPKVETGPAAPVKFRYKNHEGKTRIREVIIRRIFFGSTQWHKEPQWFLRGHCIEHNASRDFALRDCDFAFASRDEEMKSILAGKNIPTIIGVDLAKNDKGELIIRPDGTPVTKAEMEEHRRGYYHDADGDCSND